MCYHSERDSDDIAFISFDSSYLLSIIFSEFHPVSKLRMLLLVSVDSYDILKIAKEVQKACVFFLGPRKLYYFQFNRIYKNNTSIILANHPDFFKEFLEDGFIEPKIHLPTETRQNSFCFWDEILSETQLLFLKDKMGIYHGLTILNRQKAFYDCTTYAMSEPHPNPVAYYLYILSDLQNFSQLFPSRTSYLIKELTEKSLEAVKQEQLLNRKYFLLPRRSSRFYIGKDVHNYITTYEAICMQLAQEGKSYKEISSLLSMASTTVKTHLTRLKARTGLSFQEISLQSFQAYKNTKNMVNIKNGLEKHKIKKGPS